MDAVVSGRRCDHIIFSLKKYDLKAFFSRRFNIIQKYLLNQFSCSRTVSLKPRILRNGTY